MDGLFGHDRVFELEQKPHQRALTALGGQHVETKALLAMLDLKGVQSGLQIALQELKYLSCR